MSKDTVVVRKLDKSECWDFLGRSTFALRRRDVITSVSNCSPRTGWRSKSMSMMRRPRAAW